MYLNDYKKSIFLVLQNSNYKVIGNAEGSSCCQKCLSKFNKVTKSYNYIFCLK